jgi:hypothetical protein
MKRGILQIGTLLMVANLLLGSIGFSYYEHLCHFSGKSEIRINNPSTCCEKPVKEGKNTTEGKHIKSSDCCSIDLKIVQIDSASLVQTWKAQFQSSLFLLPNFSLFLPSFVTQELHVASVQTNRWQLLPQKPKLFLVFASFLI